MKTITCDRCGISTPLKKDADPKRAILIAPDNWLQNVLREYKYPKEAQTLDLCPNCKAEFLNWINKGLPKG